jgi:hypothetical protein
MKSSITRIVVVSFFLCFWFIPVFASEIILPGADPGPNPTGEITGYVGKKGLTCPADYKPGDYFTNPYKDEKPLYRIDYTNIAKYENRLSSGQVARIKRNKNFYLNVYPTHRNFVFPKEVYAAIDKNLKTCKVGSDHKLKGYNGAIPFPTPENGIQAAWNFKKQYTGEDVIKTDTRRIVSPSGRIRKEIQYHQVLTMDENRFFTKMANPDKVAYKIISLYTYPADRAGTGTLIVQYMDDNRRDATWLYIPTLRRVRRAPSLDHGAQFGGEYTLDEFGYFFRGRVNDWNWKLLGKKEIYISSNSYGMWKVGIPDNEECLIGDINPKFLRYELRRAWVVEGTAKEGINHPYSKRVIYADEDNWYPILADSYDKRGNLWRMSESYSYLDYCTDNRIIIGLMYLNLESGKYEILGGGRTEKTKTMVLNSGLKNSNFTVQSLRRGGR